jgi:hypothetical protein
LAAPKLSLDLVVIVPLLDTWAKIDKMTALFCWYRTVRILDEDLEPEGQG